MEWIVFGAGAQGRITVEILRTAAPDVRVWLVDDRQELHGTKVTGCTVIGRKALTDLTSHEDVSAIVAIGNAPARLKVASELASFGLRFGNAIHPSAVVSASAGLGH